MASHGNVIAHALPDHRERHQEDWNNESQFVYVHSFTVRRPNNYNTGSKPPEATSAHHICKIGVRRGTPLHNDAPIDQHHRCQAIAASEK